MGDKTLAERVLELEGEVKAIREAINTALSEPVVNYLEEKKPVSYAKVRRNGKWVNEVA